MVNDKTLIGQDIIKTYNWNMKTNASEKRQTRFLNVGKDYEQTWVKSGITN